MAFNKWNTSGELTWADNDKLTAADLNDSIDETTPPIGAVIAWLKTFTGVPQTLPTGWMECDGSTISDADSPLNGQTLPDLNASKFLKGADTSGTSAGGTHSHITLHRSAGEGSAHYTYNSAGTAGAPTTGDFAAHSIMMETDGGSMAKINQADTYTSKIDGAPSNYTVVWIIRIK